MTNAMSNNSSAEVSDLDRSARCSIYYLIFSALAWLLLGGVLALVNLVQQHTPSFLADCSFLTFGRSQALQETALMYGWTINAGVALALWLLIRLGHSALRGGNYVIIGGLFWNLGIAMSLVGIATGDMTSFSLLQMPRYLHPIMLVAFAAMASPGILAWTGRKSETTFAAQWYVLAALFLFPWFFSVAQVMLLFVPVRGALQTVVATWYAQNFLSLFLAPLAVASLYYLLPKIKGRVIPSYDFAIYGFWSLLLFGTWMGGRHLVGGPFPAWIPTMAIVASALVLFHHLILIVNLRGVFDNGGSNVLKFAAFGFAGYLLNGLVDVVFSSRALAVVTQFTYFQQAHLQLCLAAFSMMVFAAIYFLAPRLAGTPWPSTALIRTHYLASSIGFIVLIISLAIAGWRQGIDLGQAKVSFQTMAEHARPWLLVATAAQALLILGNIALGINFVRLIFTKSTTESINQFQQPQALEVSAS
jgi:cytochrome c oxidase cbb3-type subunit I